MPSYDDYTINSKNPLARYAHRFRFKLSVEMLRDKKNITLLDFGCGDGNFLEGISSNLNNNHIGFEPYMDLKKSIDLNKLQIYKNWDDILDYASKNGSFDYVTCFEVLEHFSEEKQRRCFKDISTVLKKDGTIIISVPIEKGLPSLVKNLRRVWLLRSSNPGVYTFKNIFFSFFGIKTKALNKLRIGSEYLGHMGFYFDDFEKIINEHFVFENKKFSPFKVLPFYLNSQVFYTLRKK
jgi:cyclopropane fatty-acyl-phospholipid synthase-like methyltransferase